MPRYYTLQVLQAELAKSQSDPPCIESSIPESSLYAEIIFGNILQRTCTIEPASPLIWGETFPIACDSERSTITIQVRLSDKAHTCVSLCEIAVGDLLSLCKDGSALLPLHYLGAQRLKKSGIISLLLRNTDILINARLIQDDLTWQLSALKTKFEASGPSQTSTKEESSTNKKITDKIYRRIDKHPNLMLAWDIALILDVLASLSKELDSRLGKLMEELKKTFCKLTIEDSSPLWEKLENNGFLDLVTQCGIFIKTYMSREYPVLQLCERSMLGELKFRIRVITGTSESKEAITELDLKESLGHIPILVTKKGSTICMEGTHVDILREIDLWVEEEGSPNIFVLLGESGVGKSTIATTVADLYERENRLWCHLSFSRGKSDPNLVIMEILRRLSLSDQNFEFVLKALLQFRESGDFPTDIEEQFTFLLHETLEEISGIIDNPVLIILDDLDECTSIESIDQCKELFRVLEKISMLPEKIKFLITAKSEDDISSTLFSQTNSRLVTLDLKSKDVQKDIHSYISFELGKLRVSNQLRVPEGWSWNESMNTLSHASGGRFIWASTMTKFVAHNRPDRFECLRWLTENASALDLDRLYETLLDSSLSMGGVHREIVKKILFLIYTAKELLVDNDIDNILDLQVDTTADILSRLQILAKYEPGKPISMYHSSLYEYLTSPTCGSSCWSVCTISQRQYITSRCFDIMGDLLRFNICDLESSFVLNKDVPGLEERISNNISRHLLYICRYWAYHLRELPYSEYIHARLKDFSYTHLLEWFEVLSLTGKFSWVMRRSLTYAIEWIGERDGELSTFLEDAIKQASDFSDVISQCTPHIYISLLPMTMYLSPMSKHYLSQAISLPRVNYMNSGRCTVKAEYPPVIAFSSSGLRIASSMSSSVYVWNVVDGELLLGPLKGHTRRINSISFSNDGTTIATGSSDKTIRLWKIDGSPDSMTLNGHTGVVWSVVFSPDRIHLASASSDMTIRTWDVRNGGVPVRVFRGHSNAIFTLAYSPDGNFIASGSTDCSIRVWDKNDGVQKKIRNSPRRAVFSVSYLSDGRIVSGSNQTYLQIWDGESSTELLKGHTGITTSVSVSSDGKRIISGSWDKSICVWNASSQDLLFEPLKGHTDTVHSVAFAPDGNCIASSSYDGTIRLWNVTAEQSWHLEENGWIKNKKGELLIWIPPKFHDHVINEKTIRILNRPFNIKLDFEGCFLGKRWTKCFPSVSKHLAIEQTTAVWSEG